MINLTLFDCVVVTLTTFVVNVIITFLKKPKKPPLPPPGQLSLQTRNSDMDLVNFYINRSFLKTFSEFTKKDWYLRSDSRNESDVNIYKDKYSSLVRGLLVSGYHVRDDDEYKYSLFDLFIDKVYLYYISETPDAIKDMLFNYESGYNITSYFLPPKKRGVKTAIHYITSFVRNNLWIRYNECELSRSMICNESKDMTDLDNKLQLYEEYQIRKINLDIYHITDSSEDREKYFHPEQKPVEVKAPEQPTQDKKENIFKVDPKSLT